MSILSLKMQHEMYNLFNFIKKEADYSSTETMCRLCGKPLVVVEWGVGSKALQCHNWECKLDHNIQGYVRTPIRKGR